MSYPYPVKESNHKNSEIKYLYCQEKKHNRQTTSNHVHGTILSPAGEVLRKPDFYVTPNAISGDHVKKYKMHDCTVINFYNIGGIWRMGTRNSWDISNIQEFSNLSNNDLFFEVVEKCEYEFDYAKLDPSKIHTFAFSNPKCHLFASEYKIWSYDPTHDFVDAPDEYESGTEYIAYDPNTGELGIHQSALRKNVIDIMYTDRMSIIDQETNYRVAVAKLLLRPLMTRRKNESAYTIEAISKFYMENLNPESKKIFELLTTAINEIDYFVKVSIRSMNGLMLPNYFFESLEGYESIIKEVKPAARQFLIKSITDKIQNTF